MTAYRRYTYRELGVQSPTTAGAAVDMGSFPFPTLDPFHVIEGITNFSSPTALFGTTTEEGVDSPFYSRDISAREPLVPKWKRALINKGIIVVSSTHGLGIPEPILSLPPDDTCMVPISRLTDGPMANWKWKRNRTQYLAATATKESPGYWAELIPATQYTMYSCALLEEIQMHMLESVIDDGTTWSLWTNTEVIEYLNQRIAKFLVATGLIREKVSITGSDAIVPLPADLIEIRRTAWNGTGLGRVDDWMMDMGSVGWNTSSGTPYAYIEEPENPLQIQLVPTPSTSGTTEIDYVQLPEDLSVVCAPIAVPNMFAPYIKYGVMADMFSKQGEANDPERAAYCEERFQEGIALARLLMGSSS